MIILIIVAKIAQLNIVPNANRDCSLTVLKNSPFLENSLTPIEYPIEQQIRYQIKHKINFIFNF